MTDERDRAEDQSPHRLSRRRFLIRSGSGSIAAIAGGHLAAAGPTPLEGLDHSEIRFPSDGEEIKGFLCHRRGGSKRGGVVVIHEIFGLTPHIKDVAARLARAGYTALAVDYFTREGEPPPLSGGFGPLQAFVGKISDAQIIGDTTAAVHFLKARRDSNGRAGTVGFCWGGYFSMLAAAEVPHLNAAIAYYGRIRLPAASPLKPHSPLDLAAEMRAPLLAHFGAKDASIPAADAEALRHALEAHHRRGEIHIYQGAGHAFNNDTRESYDPAPASLAWRRTLRWLQRFVKTSG